MLILPIFMNFKKLKYLHDVSGLHPTADEKRGFDNFHGGSKSLHFIEKDVFSFFCAEEHIMNFEYYGVFGS